MPSVFISFRGRDQAGFAALLDRDLRESFGPDAVFLSSRSIRPGADFTLGIHDSLRSSVVLLALIGPAWTRYNSFDDGHEDWVRREIAEAFKLGLRVIPILAEDAVMPSMEQLPKDIAALARCQYLRIHHRTIDNDLARIRAEVAALLPTYILADDEAEAPVGEARLFDVPGSTARLGVISGSIRHVRHVDVWVNSENTDMEMSRTTEFTVSGIIRYLGAERDRTGDVTDDVIAGQLRQVIGRRGPVTPCAAFVTGAGALARTHGVRHIVHVASVSGAPGAGFHQVQRIGVCVTNALTEVDGLARADPAIRTVLFPLLGAGDGGAPVRLTAMAMIAASIAFLTGVPDCPLNAMYLLGYSNREHCVLVEELTRAVQAR